MTNRLIIIVIVTLLAGCSVYRPQLSITSCTGEVSAVNSFSKGDQLQSAMDKLVSKGIPGAAIAVYSESGWFTASAGYAKLEDQTPMKACHLQYLQSIAKTYLAVGILKLYEQGKIALDSPCTNYLPQQYSQYIKDAGKVTVRMLLNHTSGIAEYNSAPAYVSLLLQQPDHHFTPEDYLKYIKEKSLEFTPGSKHAYRNTNYVILALLMDAITGDHAKYLSENIFKLLGLSNTFYRDDAGYLTYPLLTNSYWDRNSNGIIENVSLLQRNNVAGLIGDDGIVATPADAVKFLKGLMQGDLLKKSTLDTMMIWVNDKSGNPTYGLGLDHSKFLEHEAYGHSGGGIGAGCQLYYFPGKDLYVFIAINLGTVTDSPLHASAAATLDEIYGILLKH